MNKKIHKFRVDAYLPPHHKAIVNGLSKTSGLSESRVVGLAVRKYVSELSISEKNTFLQAAKDKSTPPDNR